MKKRAGYKFLLAGLIQGSFLPSSIASVHSIHPQLPFQKRMPADAFQGSFTISKDKICKDKLAKQAGIKIFAIMFGMRSISRYRTTVR